MVLAVFVGLLFGASMFALSFFIDDIFHTQVGFILMSIAPVTIVFPFQTFIQLICQGTNKIKELSAYRLLWRGSYLIMLLLVVASVKLTAPLSLTVNLLGLFAAVIFSTYYLKPIFKNIVNNVRLIVKETREYGFHVYLGGIAGLSTYNLDSILISYFINTTATGFYALGVTMTTPIVMLSTAVSTSLFKRMAHMDRIPDRIIRYNTVFSLSGSVLLIVFGGHVLTVLFSDKYLETIPLIAPLALTAFFLGMFQPYNFFLGAKGKGVYLKRIAIIFSVCNILCNFILIPLYGALGAAYASLFSLIVDYALHVNYYRKTIKHE
jgi:O-antigen/teichoic acid export membrane protein